MGRSCRHVARLGQRKALVFLDPPSWRQGLSRFKPGELLAVSVSRLSPKASHSQHGYYRSEVVPFLADAWGWGDPDELHHHLKVKHLPGIIPVEDWPRRRLGDEWVTEVPSSADFTVEQFSAYLQKVLDQALDCGTPVPPPRGREQW